MSLVPLLPLLRCVEKALSVVLNWLLRCRRLSSKQKGLKTGQHTTPSHSFSHGLVPRGVPWGVPRDVLADVLVAVALPVATCRDPMVGIPRSVLADAPVAVAQPTGTIKLHKYLDDGNDVSVGRR